MRRRGPRLCGTATTYFMYLVRAQIQVAGDARDTGKPCVPQPGTLQSAKSARTAFDFPARFFELLHFWQHRNKYEIAYSCVACDSGAGKSTYRFIGNFRPKNGRCGERQKGGFGRGHSTLILIFRARPKFTHPHARTYAHRTTSTLRRFDNFTATIDFQKSKF